VTVASSCGLGPSPFYARYDFTDVHLYAVPWDGARIFSSSFAALRRLLEIPFAMPNEHAMDGIER
jgi:hypothetical protein